MSYEVPSDEKDARALRKEISRTRSQIRFSPTFSTQVDSSAVGAGSHDYATGVVTGNFVLNPEDHIVSIQLSWTGASGSLDIGDTVSTTATAWEGILLHLVTGDSTAGTGVFEPQNTTVFTDAAQTLSGGTDWTGATYTTGTSKDGAIVTQAATIIVDTIDSSNPTINTIFGAKNDGQFTTIKPKSGLSLSIESGGNFDTSSTITVGNDEFNTIQFFEDNVNADTDGSWTLSSSVSSGGEFFGPWTAAHDAGTQNLTNTATVTPGAGSHEVGTSDDSYNQMHSQFFVPEAATIITGRYGLAKTGNSLYVNFDETNADAGFSIYEEGLESFRFYHPVSTVNSFHIGNSDTFTAGEEYRIQMGESSTASARIYFIHGTGNDLILDRAGSGTDQGVQIRVSGLPSQRWLTDQTKFFSDVNVNANDMTNVVNIISNGSGGATTGVIGELITADGGFNYFVRDNLAWESDSALKIVFETAGLRLESNGTSDHITLNALGTTSSIIGNATDDMTWTSTGTNAEFKLVDMLISTGIQKGHWVDNDDSTAGRRESTGMIQSSLSGVTPKVLNVLSWDEIVFRGYGETTTALSRGTVLAYVSSSDPTATEIPSTYFTVAKNTSSGAVKLWYNDAGTLKSVTLT